MSICPKDDIHSVFIDDELPKEFRSEYIAHVSNCPACQAKLANLRNLRKAIFQDKNSISLSQKQIEENYQKLEFMLNFKKVSKNTNSEFSKYTKFFNKMLPVIAAVLIVAFFLPISANRIKNGNFSTDYVSESMISQNSFAQASIGSIFLNDENKTQDVSLIDSTEYLTKIDLENIISTNFQNLKENIYNPNSRNTISENQNFMNVYNDQENLYNVTYSPFLGF